jgi:hypothetical protein
VKTKYLLHIIILGIFVFSLINVSAFMPDTHLFIQDKATAEPISSELYTSCISDPGLCYTGNTLIDIGVYYYYTQKTKYATTHSPSFCKLLLENSAKIPGKDPNKMRICAIGGCLHLEQDLPSHSDNGLVLYSIKNSYLANSIIHVFAEQKVSNMVNSKDSGLKNEQINFLANANECEDLFIISMLGTDAFRDMDESSLREVYAGFVQEILSSTDTGYNPAFKEKSFLGDFDSIPFSILAVYTVLMSSFLLLVSLLTVKILRKQSKIRHWVGIVIFGFIFAIMVYLFIGAMTGNAFNYFIKIIKPVSNLVPIGNPDTYVNRAIENTKLFFQQGETHLIGKDPSGLGTNPVLTQADASVLWMDYLLLVLLIISLGIFIWFLFKKNKVNVKGGIISL